MSDFTNRFAQAVALRANRLEMLESNNLAEAFSQLASVIVTLEKVGRHLAHLQSRDGRQYGSLTVSKWVVRRPSREVVSEIVLFDNVEDREGRLTLIYNAKVLYIEGLDNQARNELYDGDRNRSHPPAKISIPSDQTDRINKAVEGFLIRFFGGEDSA